MTAAARLLLQSAWVGLNYRARNNAEVANAGGENNGKKLKIHDIS